MSPNNKRNYKYKHKKRIRQVLAMKLALIAAAIILSAFLIYHLYTLAATMVMENDADISGGVYSIENAENQDNTDILTPESNLTDTTAKLQRFAAENNFSVDEYPAKLIELLQKNAETEEFVLNYPLKKNTYSTDDLPELLNQDTVPLLMQWDSRWGYYEYSSSIMGLAGCGPVCLSMVAVHLLQDSRLTPVYMADYSINNGYCVEGSGTSWELMSKGARDLGLVSEEVPLDENIVKRHLQNGNPIICIMGKGDFTDEGHFIVFTGLKDDKIMINDPNSKERSEKLWDFDDIKGQILNMWAYTI